MKSWYKKLLVICNIVLYLVLIALWISIPDVLALTTEDLLKRRLQTVLVDKKLARTTRAARQLITHKKVLVAQNIVDSPSYLVSINLEDKIVLKDKIKNKKKISKKKENEEEFQKEVKETD